MIGRRLKLTAPLGLGFALLSLAVVFVTIGAVSAQDRTAAVDRGRYLVDAVAACGQCHTPRSGTEEDKSRYLSGHPAAGVAPQFSMELMQQGVFISISPTYTAFSGPWGSHSRPT